MSEKMLTENAFVGWYKSLPTPPSYSGLECWQAALAWAESSKRYIRVPDVSEWPENAGRLSVYYCDYGKIIEGVTHIPRPTPPTPPWEPKVGELVLFRSYRQASWLAGKVRDVDDDTVIIQGRGEVEKYNLAPFDQSKIGEAEK